MRLPQSGTARRRRGARHAPVRTELGGLDVAVECVGLEQTVRLALGCLAKQGRAVLVGVGPARPSLPPLAVFVGREQSLLGSFGMDRGDIEDLLALVACGKLDLSRSVSARYALEDVNQALAHLATRQGGVVRVVVRPQLGPRGSPGGQLR